MEVAHSDLFRRESSIRDAAGSNDASFFAQQLCCLITCTKTWEFIQIYHNSIVNTVNGTDIAKKT